MLPFCALGPIREVELLTKEDLGLGVEDILIVEITLVRHKRRDLALEICVIRDGTIGEFAHDITLNDPGLVLGCSRKLVSIGEVSRDEPSIRNCTICRRS